ncbi:unnamed protein product, partial [Rhizoctonia solani]
PRSSNLTLVVPTPSDRYRRSPENLGGASELAIVGEHYGAFDSNEYFIGPDVPGVEPIPDAGFKDSDNKIKKQAARFRVYAFDKDSKPLGEIKRQDYSMKWTVHVCNKKAAWLNLRGRYEKETWQLRNESVQGWPLGMDPNYEYTNTRNKLIIDSGEQLIESGKDHSVALVGEFQGSLVSPIQVQLGELRTDESGRLLVLASDGQSFSVNGAQELNSQYDNADWVDKMCDGSIRITVGSHSQPRLEFKSRNKATIIMAPPRFASGIHCATSLYELIEDIYERPRRGDGYDVGEVEYYRDIYPLFKRSYLLSWTNNYALGGHGSDSMDYFNNPDLSDPDANGSARRAVFTRIRAPVIDGDKENERLRDQQAKPYFMPLLSGDGALTYATPGERNTWASLTQLQYDRLKKWSQGSFTARRPGTFFESTEKVALERELSDMTRSALEWSIGAPLYPGIEVDWASQSSEMYNPEARFRHAGTVMPGDLTKGLSLPWQSDFNLCDKDWCELFAGMSRGKD